MICVGQLCGRGTNVIAAAYEGRRVVSHDLSHQHRIDSISVFEHTRIKPKDLVLHQSCGVELAEFAEFRDHFDLVLNDPPYIYGAEQYGDDNEICVISRHWRKQHRNETVFLNLKRLIKPSNFRTKDFHPIILKVGSGRRGETDLSIWQQN